MLLVLNSYSQMPDNFVPNYGFENGTYPDAACMNQRKGLSDWTKRNDDPVYTADWWSYYHGSIYCNFGNGICSALLLDGDKFVWLGKDEDTPGGDAILAHLTSTLEKNKKYKLRIWAVSFPYNFFTIHLTNYDDGGWKDDAMLNTMVATIPSFSYTNKICKGFAFETIVTINKDDIKNIVIEAGGGGTDGYCHFELDNVELYPYCTEWIVRQNRIYKHEEEKEEAGNIIAGYNVASSKGVSWPTGDVHMFDGSKTTYKANSQVDLLPGFTVERGGDFLARIAPCGQDCMPPDGTAGANQALCGGQTITLGSSSMWGCTYSWSADPSSAMQYLSNTNTANPTFTAPTSGQGVIKYTVTITNQCGQSTQRTVIIRYDNNSNDLPNFVVTQFELVSFNPSFTLNVDQHTEEVIVQLLDCNGNLIKEYPPYLNGIDFTNNTFPWTFNEFVDPCGCYNFKIKSKNYCSNVWHEQVLHWNLSTNFSNDLITNIVLCKDVINNMFCIKAHGTKNVNITIISPNNNSVVFSYSGPYTSNPMCFPLTGNILDGPYGYIVEFFDCNGVKHAFTGIVLINGCFNSSGLVSTINDGSGILSINENTQFIENGVADSLYSLLSPNPVTGNSILSYHLPENGYVKISICNSNFQQLSVLVNEDKPNGDFTTTVSAANLPLGPNYYMIEFTSTKTARIIRRFSVVH